MASLFSQRLTSAYSAIRGELAAAPQTATDTIQKLVDKIQTSPAVDDRRTAVLGLKGLSRDWKTEVGNDAMPSLLAVLQHDAPFDIDIAKAVLETLMQLCETADKPVKDDVGLKFTDLVLETAQPVHSLLNLVSTSPSFYPRFYALQFLSQLLTARPAAAQAYIMAAPPPGVDGVLSVLDPKAPPPHPAAAAPTAPGAAPAASMGGGAGEMLRNEALLLLPALLASNADLQKIVAFSGAFEKLFEIINQEGGVEGGIVVQDALTVVGNLLRFNVSNQNYFRELALIPSLPPILGFPSPIAADQLAPDDFALQYWPEQKLFNAGLVLGLIRMLIGGPGGANQSAMTTSGVTRCLLELALASNAPNGLKCQALNSLTPIMLSSVPNQGLLSTLTLAPLAAVQADAEHPNGGFIRLPLRPAVVALIDTVIHGDPSAGGRGLRGRAAGVNMFEAFVTGNDDARIGILSSMIAPPADNPNAEFPEQPQSAGSLIFSGLLDFPAPGTTFDPYRPLFACLLLAHLVRNSEHAKKIAREITFAASGGDSDDDDKVSLVQLVVGNLMMASREQTEAVNRAAKDGPAAVSSEVDDWTRVMVGYLVLLCTWLWDSPKTVKEFLSESANLQVLIGPITQPTGIDPLVQGLCAFLLGVCYEFNREPGEITRSTLHPILHSRIGPDQFVSRMARLREDPRFRAVQPDAFDTESEDATGLAPSTASAGVVDHAAEEEDEGLELWFDWAFVDFWKNHYYTIQRSIAVDPDAVRGPSTSDDGETAAMIMTLRQKLKAQTDEVVSLQSKLSSIHIDHAKEKDHLVGEVHSLSEQLASLSTSSQSAGAELDAVRAKHGEELTQLRTEHEAAIASASKSHTDALESLTSERDKLAKQVADLEAKVTSLESAATSAPPPAEGEGKKALKDKIKKLEKELEDEKTKVADNEKEHEDLLVLLEELSQKRKKDKKVMKAKGIEVSEDEDEDEDEEDEDDE